MISVVVPARNGGQLLARQLAALLAQDYAGSYEVVIADNGSTDGSTDSANFSEAGKIRVVDASATAGVGAARNVGVRAARGDQIVLCDADDVVCPGWVSAMAGAFDSGAQCVGGVVERYYPGGEWIARDSGVYELFWPGRPWPIGANCGFTRQVFDRVGGFDEGFLGGGDETDFFWRADMAGFPTVPVQDALVKYFARERSADIARQQFNYGRGAVRLYVKFRDLGMPPASWWHGPGVVARGLLSMLAGVVRKRYWRSGLADVSGVAGRLVQSLQSRVFYV